MPRVRRYDVVVVGGGPAGMAAACFLAEQGREVVLLEARSRDEAGPGWTAGVERSLFVRAGVDLPTPPEARPTGSDAVFTSRSGARRVPLHGMTMVDVDLRRLMARLRRRAESAEVTYLDQTRVLGVIMEGNRAQGVLATSTSDLGTEHQQEFHGDLVVDASGMKGVVRRTHPVLDLDCPMPSPEDTCTAAQYLCEIRDPAGARAFLDRHGLEQGTMLALTGVDGGFSSLTIGVEPGLEEINIIAGAIGDGRHTSGQGLFEAFVEQEPWIGRPLFGGRDLIPLRRPYPRFTAAGVALVGNSACQVYPAHASGVGNSLIAARILAEALEGKADPGDPTVLFQYQRNYMLEMGPASSAYDMFRRMSQALSSADLDLLFRAGFVNQDSIQAAVFQKLPIGNLNNLLETARAIPQAPGVVLRTLPYLMRLVPAWELCRLYPPRPNELALRTWAGMMAGLFGQRSEIRSRGL